MGGRRNWWTVELVLGGEVQTRRRAGDLRGVGHEDSEYFALWGHALSHVVEGGLRGGACPCQFTTEVCYTVRRRVRVDKIGDPDIGKR